MEILNLGIVAHVDAGKTTLTERILFETGVIKRAGSVDHGDTQTDTLEIERARGITIKSAVVSFRLGDRKVNLIDTPGHSDFIAEVERSLGVLDAVVLVVSAVEGVQAQTRKLMDAIRARGIPVIIFANKIDRAGAKDDALLAEIQKRLTCRVLPCNRPVDAGMRTAQAISIDRGDDAWRTGLVDLLAESSEELLADYIESNGNPATGLIERELAAQIASGEIVPLYFGSAMTGTGVAQLLDGIETLLPRAATRHAADAPLAGIVFKIQRNRQGEKLVFARIFSGTMTARDRISTWRAGAFGDEPAEARVTGIDCFDRGATTAVAAAGPGEIVRLHGLKEARIGDRLGSGCLPEGIGAAVFPPPALESAVHPRHSDQATKLGIALQHLAEQDPLIGLRVGEREADLSLRLFGEVQKEVIVETLKLEFGIDVHFSESQVLHIERPLGSGSGFDLIGSDENPFAATLGMRIERAEPGSGIGYHWEPGSLPHAFYRATEETVMETLEQGLHGWQVTDCVVTLTDVGYWSPISIASDFRMLAPLVLMQAVHEAGTEVCEPVEAFTLEIPAETVSEILSALVAARATTGDIWREDDTCHLTGTIPSAEVHRFEQRLPGISRGLGIWDASFYGYVPVSGEPPSRPRIGRNPLNRKQYLADCAQG